MDATEVMEARIGSVNAQEGKLPMVLCEDAIDISFFATSAAPIISEALASTKIGVAREYLLQRFTECMLAELREEDKDLGESIFEPESRMGLQP